MHTVLVGSEIAAEVRNEIKADGGTAVYSGDVKLEKEPFVSGAKR